MISNRLYGLDFFRLLAVLMVFFFHSSMHMGIDYGVLTSFIRCGAIFMTAFFILSGFVIRYVSVSYSGGVIPLLKKRIVGIMPGYWGLCFIYPLYNIIIAVLQKNLDSFMMIIKENLLLSPIELFGLQSIFDSLFKYTHNGGTWFVSCLLFCYLAFPLINQIINEITNKQRILCLGITTSILIYATFVPHLYHTSFIYTNILFRIFEFALGVLLASISISNNMKTIIANWYAFVLELIILIFCILITKELISTNDFMIYEWCSLPCFMLMIITLSSIKTPQWMNTKVVSYGCEISYMFFFAQFFTWTPTFIVLSRTGFEDNDLIKFVISFLLCTFIAVVLHELIEKPAKRIVQKII